MKSCSFSQNLIPSSLINTQHTDAIYTSRPLSALISTVNLPKKRKIEELSLKTDNRDGK